MKLNLGCGFQKMQGWVNIDSDPLCKPDILLDLNSSPWPFETDSVEEFMAIHILEHLGGSAKNWMHFWKELWRVAKPDTTLRVVVPHPRHDNFLIDPTHVRPVFPETIAMFDQMRNIRDFEAGGSETKLGLMAGIDLEVINAGYDLCEPWLSMLSNGQITQSQVHQDIGKYNNVCYQIQIIVRIIKPCRGHEWLQAFEKTMK